MFDLEQRLRQWRREIEVTLAFSSEEIDELEDHLRFSFEANLQEGPSPEVAWNRSLGGLGSASALAPEFAKDQIMPALGRLLVSWWRPALLLFLFSLTFVFSLLQGWQQSSPGYNFDPWMSEPRIWGAAWLCFATTLFLLPGKPLKNAVLAGVGNAFCLIPLMHLLFYNSLSDRIIGTGWSQMAASFGWLPVSLGLIGLVVINIWWCKRSAALSKEIPALIAVMGSLILILALSPFVSEWIGSLSIREIYRMPTVSQVTLTGEARNHFLIWKFDDVLINSLLYIANILPFGLSFLICAGIFIIQGSIRICGATAISRDEIFPSLSSLPWIMLLAGSGLGWLVSHSLEPNFSQESREILETENSYSTFTTSFGGLEIVVLLSAFVFFICDYELTKRLARASRVRLFYAAVLVACELALVLALYLLPILYWTASTLKTRPPPLSAEPEWLSWMLALAILGMAFCQIYLLAKKLRSQAGEVSIWKFEGGNLVHLGLLFGLIFACCGLMLTMVANVMAFESVTVIQAMIAWGESIKDPAVNHFYPQMYGTPDHLAFWVACGIAYLSFCLAAGLGAVIVLSALEFIRFNGFRLYKIRKARQGAVEALALNE
jgi:hypothetical protein